MNIFTIIGVGIAAAAISSVLKQYNKEYGLFISLAASVFIIGVILGAIDPVLNFIDSLAEISETDNKYIGILIKALAVCYIVQIAADCCRDSGESAIASKIELAGKIALLIISLPLFEALLGIVKDLIF